MLKSSFGYGFKASPTKIFTSPERAYRSISILAVSISGLVVSTLRYVYLDSKAFMLNCSI